MGGKLAQIGSRLVDAAAKKVADDFFKNFNKKLSSEAGGPPHEEPHAEPVPRDPELPAVSGATLGFLAAGALLIYLLSLIVLFD